MMSCRVIVVASSSHARRLVIFGMLSVVRFSKGRATYSNSIHRFVFRTTTDILYGASDKVLSNVVIGASGNRSQLVADVAR
jgi:hypothetical protein